MFESKKNNVWFNIGNQLTANTSSTLLTILGGKETLFGADFGINDITKHFKLTLTKFVGGVISISEVVKVTAKSGNSLTIVRAYEPCPLNANATVMTQSPQAFDVGDFAYMNITASDLIELGALIDTKQNNCVMLTKSANYTFTGAEANNTGFSTNTTSGNITYTINPALFPTTNGMYEFTIYKSTNDVNTVIIDVGAGKTIDTAQTYALTNYMETVTIRIASSIFVKVIATTNRMVVIAPLPTTQSTFIAGENITAGNALRNGTIYFSDVISSITGNLYNTFNMIGYDATRYAMGNSFSGINGKYLKSIEVELYKNGTPSGDLTCYVYSDLGTTLIATSTNIINESTISGGSSFYTFNFNNILLNGTTYYFKISTTRATSTTNYSSLTLFFENYMPTGYSINSSNSWSAFSRSTKFKVNLGTAENFSQIYKTDASNINKINFIGFASANASLGGNVIVDTSGLSNTQSLLSAGLDYYLSNTPGAISTTPGTNSKKCGKAVSTTGILVNTFG